MAQLLPARPVSFLPSLATALGLHEAIFIQHVHTSRASGTEYQGSRWLVASITDLEALFPYVSASTIRRTIENLREQGFLIVERPAMPGPNWYRLDYERLDRLAGELEQQGVL